MAIEGITDLEINYWAMVNLEGFKDLVDAVGGVTLNVRDADPGGGLPHESYFHYIEPGVRKLDGHETLWFARARDGSDDYSRMARQKCVMNAMLQQISPQVALRNFQKIAQRQLRDGLDQHPGARRSAGSSSSRSRPRARRSSTLSLVPPLVNTGDPDIDEVHDMVALAIDRAEGDAPPAETPRRRSAGSGVDDRRVDRQPRRGVRRQPVGRPRRAC